MDHKYMEKWSTSLTIKEIQIKTTLRFPLATVRMTIIQKQTTAVAYAYNTNYLESGD
jgi:hypothetical protein